MLKLDEHGFLYDGATGEIFAQTPWQGVDNPAIPIRWADGWPENINQLQARVQELEEENKEILRQKGGDLLIGFQTKLAIQRQEKERAEAEPDTQKLLWNIERDGLEGHMKGLEEELKTGNHLFAELSDKFNSLSGEKEACGVRVKELEARFTAPIVCMCGSTRFKQTWISENARLTGEGNIVLAVGLWGHHERVFPDEATKQKLDALYKRKIDLCDWVWVLDVGGYIGQSTRSEIEYAASKGKPIRYLNIEYPDYTEPMDPLAERVQKLEAQLAKQTEDMKQARDRALEILTAQELRQAAQSEAEMANDPDLEGFQEGADTIEEGDK
jgi:hypothetical protein